MQGLYLTSETRLSRPGYGPGDLSSPVEGWSNSLVSKQIAAWSICTGCHFGASACCQLRPSAQFDCPSRHVSQSQYHLKSFHGYLKSFHGLPCHLTWFAQHFHTFLQTCACDDVIVCHGSPIRNFNPASSEPKLHSHCPDCWRTCTHARTACQGK